MRILVDTNIILDFYLKRPDFFEDALQIIQLVGTGKVEAFVSATTITDIYYIAHKFSGRIMAKDLLFDLVRIVKVATVDSNTILQALNSNFKDFEDAVQIFTAYKHKIDGIVTRNPNDFKPSNLFIFSPKQLLIYCNQNKIS